MTILPIIPCLWFGCKNLPVLTSGNFQKPMQRWAKEADKLVNRCIRDWQRNPGRRTGRRTYIHYSLIELLEEWTLAQCGAPPAIAASGNCIALGLMRLLGKESEEDQLQYIRAKPLKPGAFDRSYAAFQPLLYRYGLETIS